MTATRLNEVPEVSDEDFGAEVLLSPRPVLVEFTADWCPPCRQMAPVLSALAEAEREWLKVVRLDVDSSPETTLEYGVLSMPTLMVFRDGEPAGSVVGARSGRRLREELDRFLGRGAEGPRS
ncbi:thioredoxin family protein [Streptomyces sp. NPDC007088]|uniref:thioredoxin family protein n=1 Tax=Streptomyces sp. NPDC007088 TaxID=3364773 RepID=UPI003688A1D3